MINSTTSTDRAGRPVPVATPSVSTQRPLAAASDHLSTANAAFLRTELMRQPEIRPEVVERARALAADPNYPPRDVLKNVSAQILNSADLSEDAS